MKLNFLKKLIIETDAAEFGRKNKICKEEQDEWGIIRVEIEAKKGKWLDEHFPKGKKKGEERIKSRDTTLLDEGITKDESSNARLVYDEPDLVKESIEEIKLIESKAAAAAEFAKRNKIGKEEQDQWGVFRV